MNIFILDNYDSFTYNLVHLVREVSGHEPTVKRNDETTIGEMSSFSHIILSPGPGVPDDAGIMKDAIHQLAQNHKIFGVCLGLQAIGEVYGAQLLNLDNVFHGQKMKMIKKSNDDSILKGIPSTFEAGRYHSWVINRDTLSDQLIVSCEDEYGQIMGIRHRTHAVFGVQFHPESIMTEHGNIMIQNFLAL
jgi:anthranilate synthase component 2